MKANVKRLVALTIVLSTLLSFWQAGTISAEEPPSPEPPQTGTITAHKFHDADGNAVQDDGEDDLADWVMRVYRWDDGQNPMLVAEGSTNSSGEVTFDDLEPGRYKVWEADRECWEPPPPAGPGSAATTRSSTWPRERV